MLTKIKNGRKAPLSSGSSVGLLLLDASRNAIYSNAAAVHVLAYPEGSRDLDEVLGEKMHLLLPETESCAQSTPWREFVSGRRRYRCRVIPVGSCQEGVPDATVVVLERSVQESFSYAQARSG